MDWYFKFWGELCDVFKVKVFFMFIEEDDNDYVNFVIIIVGVVIIIVVFFVGIGNLDGNFFV